MGMEDQRPKTLEHIAEVRKQINIVIKALEDRGKTHDASKLESPERDIFDEYTPKLRDTTYGSDEYKEFLKGMKPALDHHYANNRHHPEHFEQEADARFLPEAIWCMNLIDIIEMLCDWKAATLRHADGDIFKSIEINQKRFGYSDELKAIFMNTVAKLEDPFLMPKESDRKEADKFLGVISQGINPARYDYLGRI